MGLFKKLPTARTKESVENTATQQLLVFYRGDLNDPNPHLDYDLQLSYSFYFNPTVPLCLDNGGRGYGSPQVCGWQHKCTLDVADQSSSKCLLGRPVCANNDGKGFGRPFPCGHLLCAKDDGESNDDASTCFVKE